MNIVSSRLGAARAARYAALTLAAAVFGSAAAAAQTRAPIAPETARATSDPATPEGAPARDLETPKRLDRITVEGRGMATETGGYTATTSAGATKTDTPLIETPQTVDVITRAQIEDQGSHTINEALRYTPGAFTGLAGASKRQDVVSLRGFHAGDVNNAFLDGLRLQSDPGSYSNIRIDPFFLERIDVVKGPSSALYGRSMPGGLVNYTTKKPRAEVGRHIQFYGGSFDTFGGGLDLTGPLPAPDWGSYRLVGKASTTDTQFDVVKRESYAVMPEIHLDLSDDTEVLLQAYIQHDPAGGFHGAVPYDLAIDGTRFGATVDPSWVDADAANAKFNRNERLFSYVLDHRISDRLRFSSRARYSDVEVELAQVYQAGFASTDSPLLTRYYTGADEHLKAFSTDNRLQFTFATGAIQHRVLAGIDYQQRDNTVENSAVAYDPTAAVPSGVRPLDPFDPDYSGDALLRAPAVSTRTDRQLKQAGVYIQDQLTFKRVQLLLSGREDYLERDYLSLSSGARDRGHDHAFSGRAAVLYESQWGASPYFAYSEAFNPSADATVDGIVPSPVDSHQYEIGLKYQPPGRDDLFTLALYDLVQNNIQQRASVTPVRYISAGDVESKGVELTANAAVTDRLHVVAGYSYTDIEYQDTIARDGVAIQAGHTPVLSPDQLASLWVEYDVLSGVRAGLGGRYVGESEANAANTRNVPDYALMDAFIGVDLDAFGLPLDGASLRVNANNVLDNDHVTGCFDENYCYFGDARQVTATFDYRF